MRSHDIGLDSLAKAMGESIDKHIASNNTNLQLGAHTSSQYPLPNGSSYPHYNGGSALQYHIQGKMLKCEMIITQEQFEQIDKNEIKRRMVSDMVNQMLHDGCIEFTMTQTDPVEQLVKVRARVFVTPNDQVKILRENGVK